jgi:hypothetical protein
MPVRVTSFQPMYPCLRKDIGLEEKIKIPDVINRAATPAVGVLQGRACRCIPQATGPCQEPAELRQLHHLTFPEFNTILGVLVYWFRTSSLLRSAGYRSELRWISTTDK